MDILIHLVLVYQRDHMSVEEEMKSYRFSQCDGNVLVQHKIDKFVQAIKQVIHLVDQVGVNRKYFFGCNSTFNLKK